MMTTNRESQGAEAKLIGVINGLAAAEHPSRAERVKSWRSLSGQTM
jgi:hypothetical protein